MSLRYFYLKKSFLFKQSLIFSLMALTITSIFGKGVTEDTMKEIKILPIVNLVNQDQAKLDITMYDIPDDELFGVKPLALPLTFKSDIHNSKRTLTLRAKQKEAEYFGYMQLQSGEEMISLLVKKEFQPLHEFSYTPEKGKKIKKISVAGTFNSWNANNDRLKYDPDTKQYLLQKKLSPGNYIYKFVVDGQWIADPKNKLNEADGMGGTHSRLNLSGKEKSPLYLRESSISKDSISFQFAQLKNKPVKIWVELDNHLDTSPEYTLNSNKLKLRINNPDKYRYIRVIVFQSENAPDPYVFGFEVGKGLNYDESFDWRKACMYYVVTDRFHNGNGRNDNPIIDPELFEECNYHGGDFQGIEEKLNEGYFKKLGIDILWLAPVLKNPDKAYHDSLPPHYKFSGYHGYWPVEPRTIEPRFGGKKGLKNLVNTAHEQDIRILADLVAKHTHTDHPYFKKHPEWYGELNLADGRKNLRLFDEYPLTTWFDEFLPAFDYEKNPEATDQMVADAIWLIDTFGIDGFRQDAVKHIPHVFWKALKKELHKKELKEKKSYYQVGESISDYKTIKSYSNYGELDGQFDFPLCWQLRDCFAWESKPLSNLVNAIETGEREYGYDSLMAVFLGNHDFARFISYCDYLTPELSQKEKELYWKDKSIGLTNPKLSYQKMRNAYGFLFATNGITMLYYGDEIGLYGLGDPDNRRDMHFDFNRHEQTMYDWISRLNAIRKEHPALYMGSFTPIISQDDILVFRKDSFNDHILVVVNRLKKVKEIILPFDIRKGTELIKGKAIEGSKIKIHPYETMFIQLNQ